MKKNMDANLNLMKEGHYVLEFSGCNRVNNKKKAERCLLNHGNDLAS